MKKGTWRISASVLAVALTNVATPAAAQDEGAAPALEEITVTARKRAESLQDTPLAVTAMSAAALEERQVSTIADVGKFTPNVSFDGASAISGSSNSATVFIRGIGQTDFNLTIDPGVGIYLDGVYISRAVGALLDTADTSQVEILRGPQGTLFGKNTIGGAVVITSKAPSQDFELNLEGATGRYSRTDFKGGINLPVSEDFAVRASLSYQGRDGYGKRLTDGWDTGNKNSLSGRIVAAWTAADDITVTLAADATRAREHEPPIKVLAINEFGFFPLLYNNFGAGGVAGCANMMTGPSPLDNPACYNSQWLTDSKYTNSNSQMNRSSLDVWGLSLTVEKRSDIVNVKSITAYRDLESTFSLEHDGAPVRATNSANDYSQWQFSQELQFSGTAFDRLKWLMGLYYLKEKGTDRNGIQPGTDQPIGFLSGGKVDNDSYAAFAQLIYPVTDQLNLTLGGRYTHEKKRFLADQYVTSIAPSVSGFLAMLGIVDFNGDGGPLEVGDRFLPYAWSATTAKEFTPAVTLDYRFDDGPMVYATYSRGFKSGGFTQRVFPPLTQTPSFKPEFVTSYEMGVKSELFDRRLRLNVAGFYTDYKDLQTTVTVLIAPTVQNAGKARMKGIEAEFEAATTGWLTLNGGFGYTHSEYLEVPAVAAPVTVDSKLPNAPKWTGTAGFTADVLTLEAGKLSLRGDWAYRSSHYKDAANTALLRQPGYSTFNASLTFTSDDARWAISTGATNLTNKKYMMTGYADLAGAGMAYAIYARPVEWFLRLKYSL